MEQHSHLCFSVHCTTVNAAWTPGRHPHLSFLLWISHSLLSLLLECSLLWSSFWRHFLRLTEQSEVICVGRREGGYLKYPKKQVLGMERRSGGY